MERVLPNGREGMVLLSRRKAHLPVRAPKHGSTSKLMIDHEFARILAYLFFQSGQPS